MEQILLRASSELLPIFCPDIRIITEAHFRNDKRSRFVKLSETAPSVRQTQKRSIELFNLLYKSTNDEKETKRSRKENLLSHRLGGPSQ